MLPPSASPRKAAARPAAAPPSIATASPSARPEHAAHLQSGLARLPSSPVRRLRDGSAPPAPPSPLAGTASLDDDGLGGLAPPPPSHHPHAPTANPWLSPTWLPGTPPGGAGRAVSRGARSVSAVSDEVEEDIDEALYDELAMIAPSRGSSRQYGYASAPYGSPGYSPPLMDSGEPSMDPSMDNSRVDTPAEPLPPAERAARAAGLDENGGAPAAAAGVLSMHTAPASLLRAELAGAFPPPSAAPTPAARLALMTDTLAAATVGEPKAAAPAAAEKAAAAPLGEAERALLAAALSQARAVEAASASAGGGLRVGFSLSRGGRPHLEDRARIASLALPSGAAASYFGIFDGHQGAGAAAAAAEALHRFVQRRIAPSDGAPPQPPPAALASAFGGFNTALHATAPHASSGGGSVASSRPSSGGALSDFGASFVNPHLSFLTPAVAGSPHSPFYNPRRGRNSPAVADSVGRAETSHAESTMSEADVDAAAVVAEAVAVDGGAIGGCTATVCVVVPRAGGRDLHVAAIGDSRAVLGRGGGARQRAVRLTIDHSPSLPSERERVEAAGGLVIHRRVHGVLGMTRAFGDFELRPSVVCEPQQLTLRLRSPDDDGGVLIIASDGLWARLDDADAVRIASDAGEPQAAAEALVREAARRGGADNMSVVVVRL